MVARTFGALLADLEKVGYEAARLPTTALTRFTTPDFQDVDKEIRGLRPHCLWWFLVMSGGRPGGVFDH